MYTDNIVHFEFELLVCYCCGWKRWFSARVITHCRYCSLALSHQTVAEFYHSTTGYAFLGLTYILDFFLLCDIVIGLRTGVITAHGESPITAILYNLTARFMGPTWGPPGADRTQVGPMLAPWTLLSRYRCLSARLQQLQCVSNGDTAVLR